MGTPSRNMKILIKGKQKFRVGKAGGITDQYFSTVLRTNEVSDEWNFLAALPSWYGVLL